ncbi:hypothetical protein A2524_02300 [Candidatus Wolfebacteria bacterium RIFOXYD12_FULL_48_21]|uniref:Vitamin K epoxide reductase domain-containing protein n=1 Tax=Candidatus Wolfebacteria bacterium RIFOXYD1_FULL_48_65 TaxID=1802561 RepID=A0A1F8E1S4_9BACT|nr:MAG: hypothetical protein A2524_02300 [Candidatus Wolfebacteria bacterium RIFOXYD12_FULL_48_21]OGM94801.1 MAG: hypothetical protein A2610_04015 [Candidatus Wolfebacteria bacterium RIFOXYD1_FULL_48_65]OGM96043.1 MAG: hypothetical protein A2532_00430 [Candidatus Wolfebacteria bacterium RIFOXYD2_FULL_48_11]
MKKNLTIWAILALSTIGFIDSVYLALKILLSSPITCSAFGGGCDIVAQSKYSAIVGVPLSMLGVLFYAAIIIGITYYLQRRTIKSLEWIAYGLLFGGLFSIYLLALQAFVIEAWCLYCVVADAIGIANALLAIRLLRMK